MSTPIFDANVQPHFRYNSEIRRYLAPTHKLRSIPDVEQQWYQAPGGDYREDLYGDGYPGSDPGTGARIEEDAVPLHLRKARVTRAGIEANTSICSGMFRVRYPDGRTH